MTGLERLDQLDAPALEEMLVDIARSLMDFKNPDPRFWGARLREVCREYRTRTHTVRD